MKTSAFGSPWLLLAYLTLSFYCLGAALMNEYVEHQSLTLHNDTLSAADLGAWHLATAEHTMPFFTGPALLLSVVLVLLVAQRPPAVPRGALWLALACHVVFWATLALEQWPLPQSPQALALWHSDWVRKALLLLEAPLALYMAYRALRPALPGAGGGGAATSARPELLPVG